MTISQTISAPTLDTPSRRDPDSFDDRAEDTLSIMEAWGGTTGELAEWASEANALATTVNGYKTAAETAETNAETAETDAQNWAIRDEDSEYTDDGGATGYSAYHWAQKSAKGERLTATSTSSVTIGTGSKTFTLVESYRAYIAGTQVRISETTDPSTNYMTGTVTSYDDSTDALVVNIETTTGSGTISAWSISLDHGGDASTLGGASIDTDGTLSGNSDTSIPTEKAVKTYADNNVLAMQVFS